MSDTAVFGSALLYWFHRVAVGTGFGLIVDGVQHEDGTFDLYVALESDDFLKGGYEWVEGWTKADIDMRRTPEQPFLVSPA